MSWIDNSRIIAIFAVVWLHVSAGVVMLADFGSQYWWIGNILDALVRWSVPVFVMISGALLLDPGKKEQPNVFYRKRLSRILIPILFWSAFYLFWSFRDGAYDGSRSLPVAMVKKLLTGRPYFHMWFLYMILGLYVFTPFLRKIVAHSTRRQLAGLVAACFVLAAVNDLYAGLFASDSKLFVNWFLCYLPYFLLGSLIRRDQRRHSKAMLTAVFLASVLATAAGCFLLADRKGIFAGLYCYRYLSLTVIPMSISVMYLLKSWNRPLVNAGIARKAATLTLGVYLCHPLAMQFFDRQGFHSMRFHPLVSVPAVALVVFAVSLGAMWVLDRVPLLKRTI